MYIYLVAYIGRATGQQGLGPPRAWGRTPCKVQGMHACTCMSVYNKTCMYMYIYSPNSLQL